jgi:hypothetical protein
MPVKFIGTSTPLIRTAGKPAMSEDCCCDETPDCNCNEVNLPVPCDCLESDLDLFSTQGDASITISGDLLPYGFRGTGFAPFPFEVCPFSGCPDISGTYIIPCQSQICYSVLTFVCTHSWPFVPTYDYYYETRLTMRYLFTSITGFPGQHPTVLIDLASEVYIANPGTSNPKPTWGVGCDSYIGTGFSPRTTNPVRRSYRTLRWNELTALHDYYRFLDCPTECNIVDQWRKCVVGTKTLTNLTMFNGGMDSCAFDGLAVSLEILAPT